MGGASKGVSLNTGWCRFEGAAGKGFVCSRGSEKERSGPEVRELQFLFK